MKPPPRAVGRQRRGAGDAAGPRLPLGLVHLAPVLGAALATVLLHLGTIGFGFVRDDHGLIERNPFLRQGFPFRLMTLDFWASAEGSSGLWRPLVLASYWLDHRLSHGTPALFHAANLAAHGAAVALVVVAMLQSGAARAAALAAGLWFAVMPAHVESVAWISGRTDLFCAAFLLAALACDRRARRLGRRWPGIGAVLFLGLALLSKETAAGFVVLAAIAEWVERPAARPGARVRWLLPYAVLTGVYLVIHSRFSDLPELPASIQAATLARRGWAGWTMLPTYLGFLWPGFPHSPDYMLALPRGPWSPRVAGGALLTAAAVGVTALLVARRRAAALPVALIWLPVVPAMAIAITQGYGFYGERHAYLPSMGAAWALALGLDRARVVAVAPRGQVLFGVLLAAALALTGWSAAVSWRLLPAWRSDEAMYHTMTRLQPEYAVGHAGWANALAAQGRDAEALREFAEAARLDPDLPEVPLSLATFHARRGDWAGALEQAGRAARLDPRRMQARRLEVTALLRLGRVAEGREKLSAILEEAPGEPRAEALMGQLLLVEGQPAEARAWLERASGWIDDDPSLSFALGTVRFQLGDPAGARAALEQTVALEPGFYDGWLRLALTCHAQGDPAARERALGRAAALPEARDGRVEQMRRLLAQLPGTAP